VVINDYESYSDYGVLHNMLLACNILSTVSYKNHTSFFEGSTLKNIQAYCFLSSLFIQFINSTKIKATCFIFWLKMD